MKRYMVFGFGNYYPGGGMNDFMFSTDTPDEAIEILREKMKSDGTDLFGIDEFQIYDLETEKLVEIKIP